MNRRRFIQSTSTSLAAALAAPQLQAGQDSRAIASRQPSLIRQENQGEGAPVGGECDSDNSRRLAERRLSRAVVNAPPHTHHGNPADIPGLQVVAEGMAWVGGTRPQQWAAWQPSSTCDPSDVPFTRSHRQNSRRAIRVSSIGPTHTMRSSATARSPQPIVDRRILPVRCASRSRHEVVGQLRDRSASQRKGRSHYAVPGPDATGDQFGPGLIRDAGFDGNRHEPAVLEFPDVAVARPGLLR
jgi:hypothetical protein